MSYSSMSPESADSLRGTSPVVQKRKRGRPPKKPPIDTQTMTISPQVSIAPSLPLLQTQSFSSFQSYPLPEQDFPSRRASAPLVQYQEPTTFVQSHMQRRVSQQPVQTAYFSQPQQQMPATGYFSANASPSSQSVACAAAAEIAALSFVMASPSSPYSSLTSSSSTSEIGASIEPGLAPSNLVDPDQMLQGSWIAEADEPSEHCQHILHYQQHHQPQHITQFSAPSFSGSAGNLTTNNGNSELGDISPLQQLPSPASAQSLLERRLSRSSYVGPHRLTVSTRRRYSEVPLRSNGALSAPLSSPLSAGTGTGTNTPTSAGHQYSPRYSGSRVSLASTHHGRAVIHAGYEKDERPAKIGKSVDNSSADLTGLALMSDSVGMERRSSLSPACFVVGNDCFSESETPLEQTPIYEQPSYYYSRDHRRTSLESLFPELTLELANSGFGSSSPASPEGGFLDRVTEGEEMNNEGDARFALKRLLSGKKNMNSLPCSPNQAQSQSQDQTQMFSEQLLGSN